MATSKNSALPNRSALPMRGGNTRGLLRPLLAILILLFVSATSIAGTWLFMSRAQQQQLASMQLGVGQAQATQNTGGNITFSSAPNAATIVPAPIFIPLEAFTVTLQDADNERILHVGITLRANDDQTRLRIEKYMPEVRNRVLMVLSSQTPQSVQSLQGKQQMASRIGQAVNRPFSPLPTEQYVTDVLFTAFVVQ